MFPSHDLVKAKRADISRRLGQALDAASEQRIDPREAIKELDPLKQKFKRLGNKAALRKIERQEAEFLRDHLDLQSGAAFTPTDIPTEQLAKAGLPTLTPKEASIIKTLNQRVAKSTFSQAPLDVAAVQKEFSKNLSTGLRKEIEKVVPEASYLNKELHVYDQLVESLSTSIARDISKGGISIAAPFTTAGGVAGGALLGGPTGALIGGGAIQISRSFPVKSFLAAKLSKVAGKQVAPELASEVMAHPSLRKAVFDALEGVTGFEIADTIQEEGGPFLPIGQ